MIEIMPLNLLLASAALTAAYWICLILGGGLVALSVLSAAGGEADVDFTADADVDFGGDIDFEADVDAEFDAGVDVEAQGGFDAVSTEVTAAGGAMALSTWFSMRFAVFFMAVFGAIGATLSSLTGLGTSMVLALALIGGLVVGQIAHQLIRFIQRSSGNTAPQPQDYTNRLARVTIAIIDPHKGEVVLQVRSAERFVPAVGGAAQQSFEVGDEVVVASYRAGVARVVSRAEFEQRTRTG